MTHRRPKNHYEWLADSATSSHVANRRDMFTHLEPAPGRTVAGVGGTSISIEGCGTVELLSVRNGRNHVLRLTDILYIPRNKNNLLSLGRWDSEGRSYNCIGGVLRLLTKHGIVVAEGKKIRNNLYRMNLRIHDKKTTQNVTAPATFVVSENKLT